MADAKAQYVAQTVYDDRWFFVEKGFKFGLAVNTAVLVSQAFVQYVNPVFSFYSHALLELLLILAVLPGIKVKVEPVAASILLPMFAGVYFVKFYFAAREGDSGAVLSTSWGYVTATMLTMLFTVFDRRGSIVLAVLALVGTFVASYGTAPTGRLLMLHAVAGGATYFYMNLRLRAVKRAAELEFDNKRLLEQELEFAATSQKLLLPKESELAVGDWVMASHFEAAGQISGDWWWNRSHGDVLECAIGDVTGHGGGAAMIAAMAVGAWRACLAGGSVALPDAINTLSSLLHETGGRHGMTTISLLSCEGSHVGWWSAGAPPLLILRADGKVETHYAAGSSLGYESPTIAERTFALASGERLLLFSDGVSEMRDPKGREFGVGRLARLLAKTSGVPMTEARKMLRSAVTAFRGDQALGDDLTFLLVERVRRD